MTKIEGTQLGVCTSGAVGTMQPHSYDQQPGYKTINREEISDPDYNLISSWQLDTFLNISRCTSTGCAFGHGTKTKTIWLVAIVSK